MGKIWEMLNGKADKSDMSDDFPMTSDRHTKYITEHAALMGDQATRRKAWVSGSLKNDSFLYVSNATSTSGSVTFYITDDGTSGGNAVFTNVYSASVAVMVYGASGNFQAFSPTVAGDRKSVTCSLSQITTILGLLTFNGTAGAGLDCRLYIMGD